ncbi:hypothetical protein [Glaciecola petra]|uniref:Uncharacterized protein n=1 Tax=Glaciecola petra TaxID=3075602 RepID=A0ABU2ZUN0_9ALTE|nr:hypothetical protein [Aestuariibacter sp. P117]MDT0595748.1 hypothetical protein [Aestuariibacter sp. P117]
MQLKVAVVFCIISAITLVNVIYNWMINSIGVVGNPELHSALLFLIIAILLQKPKSTPKDN